MAAKKKTTTTKKKTAARKPAAKKRAAAVELPEVEGESHAAGKALVIVESPAKAKTIGRYLGAS